MKSAGRPASKWYDRSGCRDFSQGIVMCYCADRIRHWQHLSNLLERERGEQKSGRANLETADTSKNQPMFKVFRWLLAGIRTLCLILLLGWGTLAIYYSNLPWGWLRLVLALFFL